MRRLPTFWLVQLAGWGAYGMSTFLTMLPTLPPSHRLPMLGAKLARAALGLVASLVLHRLYRRLRAAEAPPWAPPWATVLATGAACAALGAGWLLAYWQLIVPALHPAPPGLGWEAFPRAALDFVLVLLAWSAAYFAI